MKVRLSPPVVDFVRSLAPEPRRRIRLALRDLEKGTGDVAETNGSAAGVHAPPTAP